MGRSFETTDHQIFSVYHHPCRSPLSHERQLFRVFVGMTIALMPRELDARAVISSPNESSSNLNEDVATTRASTRSAVAAIPAASLTDFREVRSSRLGATPVQGPASTVTDESVALLHARLHDLGDSAEARSGQSIVCRSEVPPRRQMELLIVHPCNIETSIQRQARELRLPVASNKCGNSGVVLTPNTDSLVKRKRHLPTFRISTGG
jgi:hypothetical protein